jgi:putative transposase
VVERRRHCLHASADTSSTALKRATSTYYRWHKEYGGQKTDQAQRMKDLEKENLRLRRAVSDLTLDKLILQEAARGTVTTGVSMVRFATSCST